MASAYRLRSVLVVRIVTAIKLLCLHQVLLLLHEEGRRLEIVHGNYDDVCTLDLADLVGLVKRRKKGNAPQASKGGIEPPTCRVLFYLI